MIYLLFIFSLKYEIQLVKLQTLTIFMTLHLTPQFKSSTAILTMQHRKNELQINVTIFCHFLQEKVLVSSSMHSLRKDLVESWVSS